MAIRLTEQQQHALDSTDAQPPQGDDIDEAVREIVEDERQQSSIRVVALRNASERLKGPEGD
jgi:hypothetical protein